MKIHRVCCHRGQLNHLRRHAAKWRRKLNQFLCPKRAGAAIMSPHRWVITRGPKSAVPKTPDNRYKPVPETCMIFFFLFAKMGDKAKPTRESSAAGTSPCATETERRIFVPRNKIDQRTEQAFVKYGRNLKKKAGLT